MKGKKEKSLVPRYITKYLDWWSASIRRITTVAMTTLAETTVLQKAAVHLKRISCWQTIQQHKTNKSWTEKRDSEFATVTVVSAETGAKALQHVPERKGESLLRVFYEPLVLTFPMHEDSSTSLPTDTARRGISLHQIHKFLYFIWMFWRWRFQGCQHHCIHQTRERGGQKCSGFNGRATTLFLFSITHTRAHTHPLGGTQRSTPPCITVCVSG